MFMKNPLGGGLMSLIPRRKVRDPDEVIDDAVEEEAVAEEELEKLTVAGEEAGSEEESISEAYRQTDEGNGKDNESGEDEVKVGVSTEDETEVKMPQKPNVTPISLPEQEKVDTKESGSWLTEAARKQVEKMEEEARKAAGEEEGDAWERHESKVQQIFIGDIRINPGQPRQKFDPVAMEELTNSVEKHGILQPLVVRRLNEGGYELVAGERRLRAAKGLNWEKVPCVVRRGVGSGSSSLELALIENIQRTDLNPIEEALALKKLNEEYGMTHEEIGERVGRSRVGVTNIIRVLQLPAEIQRGIMEGKIMSGHARAILMIPDEEKQIRFYRHLVEEGLTVRKAETRARRIQRSMEINDPMRIKRKGRSAFEIKQAGLLEDRYGYDARVHFDEEKDRYDVSFRCHNRQEIKELLDRLLGNEALPGNVDSDVMKE
jgi:ParB family transcriptional regulator, chromosome partitioning protein